MDVDTVIDNPSNSPKRSTLWFDRLQKGAKLSPVNESPRKKWYSKLASQSIGQNQNPTKDISMRPPHLQDDNGTDGDEEDNNTGGDEEGNIGGDEEGGDEEGNTGGEEGGDSQQVEIEISLFSGFFRRLTSLAESGFAWQELDLRLRFSNGTRTRTRGGSATM